MKLDRKPKNVFVLNPKDIIIDGPQPHININVRAGALVQWLWEETHVPKVVSSNPGTVY